MAVLSLNSKILTLISFCQAEVDRFQDTIYILKDYYGGMQVRIPAEMVPPSDFMRLPLIELDVGGEPSASVSAATIPR